MPAAKDGTRDYCHFCEGVVEYGFIPEMEEGRDGYTPKRRYYNRQWYHVDPKNIDGTLDWHKCAPEKPESWSHQFTNPHYIGPRVAPERFCIQQAHYGVCNRAIKDQELRMCGIHASHAIREMTKREQAAKQQQLNEYLKAEVGAICHRLKEEYGVDAHLQFRENWGGPTGMIVVDPSQLLKFLESTDEEF